MAQATTDKVLVIPCSGVGKVHGLMAREATYRVVDELEPGASDTLCLALLVKGDEEAVGAVRTRPCITIDGCPKLCSYKNVELAGGSIAESVRVVDAFKGHKGAKPGTATELAEDGWTITDEIAQHVAARVRKLCDSKEK
ncbi:MAG: putative zinc-binding protein [Armatimonadota bacterium]